MPLMFLLTIDLLAINDNLLYISISTKQPGKFSINCALHGRKKAVFESPFSWLPIILKWRSNTQTLSNFVTDTKRQPHATFFFLTVLDIIVFVSKKKWWCQFLPVSYKNILFHHIFFTGKNRTGPKAVSADLTNTKPGL